MNISKFIKENKNPYETTLDTQIDKVSELVDKKAISAKLGAALIEYFIRKDVSELIKHNIQHIINPDKREKWLFVNFNRRTTTYA